MDEDYDELDDIMMRAPSQGEAVKQEHDLMNKAASHPLRRKMISAIGSFGIAENELAGAVDSDDTSIKYHVDFLLSGDFIKTEGGSYRLTDKGLELLSDCNARDKLPKC
ncbi:putative transcriptional regulator [Methanohalophilus levihalophilus]|uniref:winged helix-turn-helix domain-containing protein n=1 Tax=Methanohalophilus levihalophilus TaxID=1431282 RepID=UPI001AE1EE07|nr:winged helix-turn-helix domain-containing protein [Methanohalophilus levihalophilus]MBP2031291.1 putative transcriptional regulator [Methanohalophilus levihalophilus]